MTALEREQLLRNWDEGWTDGSAHAPWSRVLHTLIPEQAAWKPAEGRHSIWQIANHLIFWREYSIAYGYGGSISDQERERRNFEEPHEVTAEAWQAVKQSYQQSHQRVREAIEDPATDLNRFHRLDFHESYHVGQIMYLRALQNLPPLV